MKAIRIHEFGAPEVLQLEEVVDPSPGPGQVVVRMRAVGVNPVETYIRSGIYPKPPTPFTPGSDGAGVIEAVGEGVDRVAVGDRVYLAGSLSGTYAEQALCKQEQVHPLGEQASFAQGAAVFVPYATAYQALFHCGHASPGETLFVHGASGGVGIAGVQLGRAAGLRVIGTASTERGRQLVSEQGAQHVFDHSATSYMEEVKNLTAGRGVDVILEMLANVNLAKDIDLLAMRGSGGCYRQSWREESGHGRDQSPCGHDARRLHHRYDLTQRYPAGSCPHPLRSCCRPGQRYTPACDRPRTPPGRSRPGPPCREWRRQSLRQGGVAAVGAAPNLYLSAASLSGHRHLQW